MELLGEEKRVELFSTTSTTGTPLSATGTTDIPSLVQTLDQVPELNASNGISARNIRSSRSTTRSDVQAPPNCPELRTAISLAVHFLTFFGNYGLFYVLYQAQFFPALYIFVFTWCLGAVVSSYIAMRDSSVRLLEGWSLAVRALPVFVVYGLLQGMHVKQLLDFREAHVECRKAGVRIHMKSWSAYFDGKFNALFSFVLFNLDDTAMLAPWSGFMPLVVRWKWMLALNGFSCLVSIASGACVVDCRVSRRLRRQRRASMWFSFLHWLYRFAEVGLDITGTTGIWLALFETPSIRCRPEGTPIPGFLLPSLIAAALLGHFICMPIFHFLGHMPHSKRDSPIASSIVGFCAFTADPTVFLDEPGFSDAGKRASLATFCLKVVFALIVIAFPLHLSYQYFPKDCRPPGHEDLPLNIGMYILAYLPGIIIQYLSFLAVRILILARFSKLRWGRTVADHALLELIPADNAGAARLRRYKPRGLNSFLLQAGLGFESPLLQEEAERLENFEISKQIGTGTYGVVVLVRKRGRRGESFEDTQPIYAMKLMNLAKDPAERNTPLRKVLAQRDTLAARERDIMVQLQHPFIVQLLYYFEVPDREWRCEESQELVRDEKGHTRFHKAIVMEFCEGGDLQDYTLHRAFRPDTVPSPHLDEEALDWLQFVRRLAAECASAIMFLHSKNIIHRDLKPQNILLRSGEDTTLHGCLADFGFAKQQNSRGWELQSLAGSPMYSAPEVLQIARTQTKGEYTPAVDLYSFGRLLLVVLWRTHLRDAPGELQLPQPQQVSRAKRQIPPQAQLLTTQLTAKRPDARGQAHELKNQFFFGRFMHEGRLFEVINWERISDGV